MGGTGLFPPALFVLFCLVFVLFCFCFCYETVGFVRLLSWDGFQLKRENMIAASFSVAGA